MSDTEVAPAGDGAGHHPGRAPRYPGRVRFRLPSPNRSAEITPMRVNMRAVFLLGTAAWLAGALTVGIWLLAGSGARADWLSICGAGVAIGLVGWAWSRWRHW